LPTSVDINGNGIINGTGIATNFIVYGLPSNNTFKLAGGADVTGIIYAPYAELKMTGGGNFYGSTTTYSAVVNGTYNFFYPEFLKSLYVNKFIITSWNELSP
jgi:hypothetical protein